MKQALFSLLVLCGLQATAQTHGWLPQAHTAKQQQYRRFVQHMMSRGNAAAAEKTTSVQERVIAAALTEAGSGSDSTTYQYSGTRHSVYDYNSLMYSSDYPYLLSDPIINGNPNDDYTLNVQFDHATDYQPDSNNVMTAQQAYSAQYNSANMVTLYNDTLIGSTDNNHYVTIYNAQNQVAASYALSYSGNAADTNEIVKYVYDAQNHLIADSMLTNDNGGVWTGDIYAYQNDANGNPITVYYLMYNGTNYDTTEMYVSTFDASNRVTSIRLEEPNNGAAGWMTVQLDTMGYTGSNTINSYWAELQMGNGNTLDTAQVMVKYFNNAGLPDSLVVSADGLSATALVTYDSYNNPTMAMINLDGTPAGMFMYYYETYNTAVKNVVANDDFKLYPNPTTDKIYISSATSNNQLVHAIVVNALGQQVQHIAYTSSGAPFMLSLNGLSNGIYFVTLHDADGNLLHRQQVVKE